jgi:hypothetical protein
LVVAGVGCGRILGIHELPAASDGGATGGSGARDAGVDRGGSGGVPLGSGGNRGTGGGAGGALGTGGMLGSGGALGTGGSGTGGMLGSGGALGTGGAMGIAGMIGSGGRVGGTGGTIGTGGRAGTGGSGTGGALGTGGAGTIPAGYWTNGSWQGCVWVETDSVGGTTASPLAFPVRMDSASYCLSGSVEADPSYRGFAGLQFNLAQPAAGADCSYNAANATRTGLPAVTMITPNLQISFTKAIATPLQIEIEGPNGATDSTNRWCTIVPAAASGSVTISLGMFTTQCFLPGNPGTAYAGQPISSILILVTNPSTAAPAPYNFCVSNLVGFSAL